MLNTDANFNIGRIGLSLAVVSGYRWQSDLFVGELMTPGHLRSPNGIRV